VRHYLREKCPAEPPTPFDSALRGRRADIQLKHFPLIYSSQTCLAQEAAAGGGWANGRYVVRKRRRSVPFSLSAVTIFHDHSISLSMMTAEYAFGCRSRFLASSTRIQNRSRRKMKNAARSSFQNMAMYM